MKLLTILRFVVLTLSVLLLLNSAGASGVGLAQKTITVCPSGCEFAKIQDAINAASEGDMIQVRSGTYQENLRVTKGLVLQGEGPDKVTIQGSVSILAAKLVTIQGFTVRSGLVGIEVKDSSTIEIIGNVLAESQGDGLVLTNSSVMVRGNTIRGHRTNGSLITMDSRVVISGNTVSRNRGDGIAISASTVDLRDNLIADNQGCGVRADDKATMAGGNNNGWGGSKGAFCGNVPVAIAPAVRDASELLQAVEAVEEGAIIVIAARSYEVNLSIGKSLRLVGAGPDKTILKGRRDYAPILHIQSSTPIDVKVENLTKSASGLSIGNKARLSLNNSQVSGNRYNGLMVRDSATVSLTDSTVSGNGDAGLDVGGSARVSLTGSTVSGNGDDGLIVMGSARLAVHQSNIMNNGTSANCGSYAAGCEGVSVVWRSQTMITDSVIKNNTHWGVAAWLQKCGYLENNFAGSVVIGNTQIYGNGAGQVCLP